MRTGRVRVCVRVRGHSACLDPPSRFWGLVDVGDLPLLVVDITWGYGVSICDLIGSKKRLGDRDQMVAACRQRRFIRDEAFDVVSSLNHLALAFPVASMGHTALYVIEDPHSRALSLCGAHPPPREVIIPARRVSGQMLPLLLVPASPTTFTSSLLPPPLTRLEGEVCPTPTSHTSHTSHSIILQSGLTSLTKHPSTHLLTSTDNTRKQLSESELSRVR